MIRNRGFNCSEARKVRELRKIYEPTHRSTQDSTQSSALPYLGQKENTSGATTFREVALGKLLILPSGR